MALIKTVLFLKKWDDISYQDKVLKLVNPIASVVDHEVFKNTEGYWPDIYSLSFKTEDQEISDTWEIDSISNNLESRWDTIVGVQSGETLMLFDVKMYDSYPPNAKGLYEQAINDGVQIKTKDDLFH